MNRQTYRHHSNIGYTFVPGLKMRVGLANGGYLLRTNQAGFRSEREFEPAKRPGVFRILLFGDSFTAADSVSNKHRYSDVLETLIPNLEVYNFGLSGTGTDQQFLAFQEFAPQYEHDLVVIAPLVENIRRNVAKYRTYASADGTQRIFAKPYFELDDEGKLVRYHYPVPKDSLKPEELPAEERQHVDRGGRFQALRQVVSKLGPTAKGLVQRVTRYQPLPGFNSADHPDWRLMQTILREWIKRCERPVVLFPLPLYQYIEETADASCCQARFAELASEMDIVLCDPLGDLLQTPASERTSFRFKNDVHPTPKCHQLLAASLARAIRPMMPG